MYKEAIKLLGEYKDTVDALSFSMKLLLRIRRYYPHVFGECISKEDIRRLCDKSIRKK